MTPFFRVHFVGDVVERSDQDQEKPRGPESFELAELMSA